MVINGTGFGATRGNGNVWFKNANEEPVAEVSLDNIDFLSWSSNEIKIKMPSYIVNNTKLIPGSGVFRVINDMNESVTSITPIEMPYAISNAYYPSPNERKIRLDVVNADNTNDPAIVFLLGPSITANPEIEAIIRKAIEDWACGTLIYFEIGSSTSIDETKDDGFSVIHMEAPSSSTDNRLGIATLQENRLGICDDDQGRRHVFPTEIDIAFINKPNFATWVYDDSRSEDIKAGEVDFYEVALHEIGHAGLLLHVNEDELMNKNAQYSTTSDIPSGNRRFISSNDIDAMSDVVTKGNTVTLVSCNSIGSNASTLILTPSNSCSPTGIKDKGTKETRLNIYPSPVNSLLYIEYDLINNSYINLVIKDIIGRNILTITDEYKTFGIYQEYINVNKLTPGIYFFVANINGIVQTSKIIKL